MRHRSARRLAVGLLVAIAVGGCGSDDGASPVGVDTDAVTTMPPSMAPISTPPPMASPTAPTSSDREVSTTVQSTSSTPVVRWQLEVVGSVEHDTSAFTQGLLFAPDGRLFESTGLYGESTLREVDPATGEVLRSVALDDALFAEGLALVDDRLIQLTWQEGVALVWDVDTFEQVDSFEYDGEGWGLCHDGERLAMSDGSDTLTFRDPATFAERGSVRVMVGDEPVERLNELECIDGEIWANVWQTDRIVVVDPSSGAVTAEIDASGLPRQPGADVLNGIARAPDGRIWITGKLWDRLYAIELVPV